MRTTGVLAAAWAAWACGLAACAADAALRAAAREVQARNQDAAVTVKLVTTRRWVMEGREGQKDESKSEVCGTVVDPSGLTVLSNFASDPTAQMAEMSFTSGGEKMDFKIQTDVTDVKMILADGTEIPAQRVLTDKDLDLVFVRPAEKPGKPLPYVAFAKSAEPELLDDVITLSRLGREVNRVTAIGLGTICAIVKKPRTFYVSDLASGFTSMGCPVFNAKGQTLGLCVVRQDPVKGGGGRLFGAMQPVILPAEDLLEVVKQALAAKAEEAK